MAHFQLEVLMNSNRTIASYRLVPHSEVDREPSPFERVEIDDWSMDIAALSLPKTCK